MRHLLPLLALASLLAACSSMPEPKAPAVDDTKRFAAAVATMCDVDRLAGLASDAPDMLEVGRKRTASITDKVDHPDAIELRVLLSVKGAADQGRMLRARAKELGVARCALADTLEKTDMGGLSP